MQLTQDSGPEKRARQLTGPVEGLWFKRTA